MSKKNTRLAVISAVAAGAGAAAVIAKKSRNRKTEEGRGKSGKSGEPGESGSFRNTELGKQKKNSRGIYYSKGNYEAFARPEKPEGVEEKSAYIVGSGLASLAAACFLVRDGQMPGSHIHILEAMDVIGQPATIKELMEAGDLAAKGIKSNQHMNSLLIKARKGGLVKCTHEKNVAYFGRGYDEKYYNEDGTPKVEEE